MITDLSSKSTRDNQSKAGSNGQHDTPDYEAEMLRALQFEYDGCPPDALLKVSARTENGPFLTYDYPIEQMERIAQDYAGISGPRHVYLRQSVLKQGTELPPGARGGRRHTYGFSMVKVDMDPEPGDDPAEFRARKLAELQTFQPAPSIIISSGRGLYAGWKIAWTEDWQRCERIIKWLIVQLGAGVDANVFDASHIFRISGTYNPKPDAEQFARVIELHHERQYTLDDFGEADFTAEEQEVTEQDYDEEVLPLDFEPSVRVTSRKLWERIYSEQTALDAGAPVKERRGRLMVDQSRNDFYIATQLLRHGITQGQVLTVLTHPTWFSGAKFRRTHNLRYVKLTIANASRVASSPTMKNVPEIARRLLEEMTLLNYIGYWYRYDADRGVFVECEDELLKTIQAIMGDAWTANKETGVLKYVLPHVRCNSLPDHGLVNVRNGMLDWRTGELHPHSAAYKSIVQINADWDPIADCSEVDAFVGTTLERAAAEVWWMFCGTVLDTTTPQPYRCLLALVGRRHGGKSTLLKAQGEFVGIENTSSVALSQLAGEGNQFTTSTLVGSMVNLDMDAPYEVRIKADHTLKAISGGDAISVERKNVDRFKSVYLFVKFAFAMNRIPTFGNVDEAFYSRWRVLQVNKGKAPLDAHNKATKVNAHLRLLSQKKNRDAWLLRSVKGLRAVVKNNGFPGEENEAVKAGMHQMRSQGDWVYRFVEECTEEEPNHEMTVKLFHDAYKGWILAEGGSPISSNKLRAALEEMADEGHFSRLRVYQNGHKQYVVVGRLLLRSMI